jgi:polar amino acid transport system substrate-binding protein
MEASMSGQKKGTVLQRTMLKNTFLLFSALFFAAWGCATGKQEQVPQAEPNPGPPPLRVGVSTDSPPMVFEKDGKIMGLDADLAREFAEYLGRPLKFVKVEWKSQIRTLNEGETDIIMSSMTITEERKLRVAFTNPYFESGLMAMARDKDLEQAEKILQGPSGIAPYYSIGVVSGTTGEKFVKEEFKNVRIVSFSTGQNALRDLLYGAVDLIVHDAAMIFAYQALNESKGVGIVPFMLNREKLGWAVRRNDPELLSQANAFLKSIGESGRLQEMVDFWFPGFSEAK